MFKFSKSFMPAITLALLPFATTTPSIAADKYTGVGRAATPAEIQAWDIDVRPDFKGLPKGSGSVEQGQVIWENKCASCHGTFGESNTVFTPLVGGTTKDDVKTGNVANLKRADYPGRTTMMKVASLSTLWDYIHRAMPWNAPKTLSDDEVYAVVAYLLNLSEIVPDDFTLSDSNIREVQKLMPNRNGMSLKHAMWPGKSGLVTATPPDTKNTACMSNCKPAAKVSSTLPDYAKTSHGELAPQTRPFGQTRGQGAAAGSSAKPAHNPDYALAEKSGCLACHGINQKIVGPGFNEVADKYKGQDAAAKLATKVKNGGVGVWGSIPMPAQTDLKDSDAQTLVKWILSGAPTQ
ncbi:MAG: c-type cytochrome [Rhodocyclaceae bacterium]|jgi:cytochrome c|nr:c-type cytochrome [Rhodocyclaceae bacterium]